MFSLEATKPACEIIGFRPCIQFFIRAVAAITLVRMASGLAPSVLIAAPIIVLRAVIRRRPILFPDLDLLLFLLLLFLVTTTALLRKRTSSQDD